MDVDKPPTGPEPVDYEQLPTTLQTISTFDRWYAIAPEARHDILSKSSNLPQVVQTETDKADALEKELRTLATRAADYRQSQEARLHKCGDTVNGNNEHIDNLRPHHAVRIQAIRAKCEADIEASDINLANEVRTRTATRDQARAVFDPQEAAVSNAIDAATSTAREVHAVDNPGKKIRPKRSNKATTQSGGTAPRDDPSARQPAVFEGADPPIDMNIQMSATLRSKGARHIHLTVEDEPYYNTSLQIISTEGPAAWPKRFHDPVQDSATILLRLIPKDSRPCITVNAAASSLKHSMEHGGDVDIITKMSIALSDLLTHLRDAASNRRFTNASGMLNNDFRTLINGEDIFQMWLERMRSYRTMRNAHSNKNKQNYKKGRPAYNTSGQSGGHHVYNKSYQQARNNQHNTAALTVDQPASPSSSSQPYHRRG